MTPFHPPSLGLTLAIALVPALTQAQTPPTAADHRTNAELRPRIADNGDRADPVADLAPSPLTSLDRLITRIVLDNVPHSYTDDKHWGQTVEQFAGVRLRRDGWKLETKRNWITVNHGLWQKSSARLVDPEHQFSIELKNIRPTATGQTAVDIVCRTPLAIDARQSFWAHGVQFYSLSADAEANVCLTLGCEWALQLDAHQLPPEVVLDLRATSADIQVEHFAVKRISKIGGEVAQQVTKWVAAQLDEQIAAKEAKLVEKINREIERHRDELRVGLPEALASPWKALVEPREKSANHGQ